MSETFTMAGHSVGRVGFGAMQLPGPGVMGAPNDHNQAVAVLRRAVELGINHIDTAEFYGPHVANQLIREALHPYGEDLVLVSKTGACRDEAGAWLPAQTPEQLVADTHQNLETLGIERLQVMNLRVMPKDEHSPADYVEVPLDEQLDAMRRLVDEGAIEAFGVSTVTVDQASQAIDAGAVCVQNAYNLLARTDEDTLEMCAARGVAYVPYFPLGSAFGWFPRVDEAPQVKAVAERLGHTPAQVGLAWLLHRAPNILLIPGTGSLAHLEENTAVREITLDEADMAELEGRQA
ncbi:oxidoreductase [Luteococcus peritonei]|uniref:Oxidoreductase n=1 Tax=Luteococcus peritonei TaxID=88874 RepID=A0ABW4RVL6_9ACTN